MSEDVSAFIRIGMAVMLLSGFVAVVVVVANPTLGYITKYSDKYTVISGINYNKLANMSGKNVSGARIYKDVDLNYDEVSTVIVREHPLKNPSSFSIVFVKTHDSEITFAASAISSAAITSYEDGLKNLSETFKHDMVNDRFILTVNVLPDQTLELLCDKVDDYNE